MVYVMTFIVVTLLSACSDDLKLYLEKAENPEYYSVYIPQAHSLQKKSVYVSSEIQQFNFSAYYGGVKAPDVDIKVNFKIDESLVEKYNMDNGTNYPMLPKECFELETNSTCITAGTFSSALVNVNLTTEGYLEVGSPYLLPISIEATEPEVAIPDDMRNAYFLVTGSFKPGQVPREKVYTFENADVGILFCKGNDLVRRSVSGDLMVYKASEDGTYQDPRIIGTGWDGMDNMFYMPDNRIIGRKPDMNIEQYNIDDNYNFLGQRTIGWGWIDNPIMFPMKDIMVLSTSASGNLTKYPISQSGDWDYGNISVIGTGFDVYTQLFCYDNSIIGIDGGGNMWETPITDNGVLGTKRQMGTGWEMYVYVIKSGTDLLALDKEGALWRYDFNLNSSWPLKE